MISDDPEILLSKFINGNLLPDEEFDSLEEHLANHSDDIQRIVRVYLADRVLYDNLAAFNAIPRQTAEPSPSLGTATCNAFLSVPWAYRSVSIAVTVTMILIVLLLPDGSKVQQDSQVATLANTGDAVWGDGSDHRKHTLDSSDTLELVSGRADIHFLSGVDASIVGPASMIFVAPNHAALSKGTLVAESKAGAYFRVDSPLVTIKNWGTKLGVRVDGSGSTDVVTFDGETEVESHHHPSIPRRWLRTGQASCFDSLGNVSRVDAIQNEAFPSPYQTAPRSMRPQLITGVTIQRGREASKSSAENVFYQVVHAGFDEDAQAFVDRSAQWNGVDKQGLPKFLIGGDYLMTSLADRNRRQLQITLELAQPCQIFLLAHPPDPAPNWITRQFRDTGLAIGLDSESLDPANHQLNPLGEGPGVSIDNKHFTIWKSKKPATGTITLGPTGYLRRSNYARKSLRGAPVLSMYGVVAVPLGSTAKTNPGSWSPPPQPVVTLSNAPSPPEQVFVDMTTFTLLGRSSRPCFPANQFLHFHGG